MLGLMPWMEGFREYNTGFLTKNWQSSGRDNSPPWKDTYCSKARKTAKWGEGQVRDLGSSPSWVRSLHLRFFGYKVGWRS